MNTRLHDALALLSLRFFHELDTLALTREMVKSCVLHKALPSLLSIRPMRDVLTNKRPMANEIRGNLNLK